MIAWLSGTVQAIEASRLILNVQGVGYSVTGGSRLLRTAQIGEALSLPIETVMRDSAIQLYGFETPHEQRAFQTLCTVQGVGAKVALAILSALSVSDISLAIAAQDTAMFTRADGVGKRLAERLCTELKSKLAKFDAPLQDVSSGSSPSTLASQDDTPADSQATTSPTLVSDAVSALVNLGYGRSEAHRAAAKSAASANDDLGALIQLSLKELVA